MPVSVKSLSAASKLDCPFCNSPRRAEIETAIREKELLKSTVARELKMTTETVYHHMMNHVKGLKKRERVSESSKLTLNKRDIVQNTMLDLLDRFSGLIESEGDAKSLTPKVTSQLVGVAREIRASAMDLAKLEGELQEESRVTIIQFNEFKSYVIKMVQLMHCPECNAKIGNSLMEELIKVREPIKR